MAKQTCCFYIQINSKSNKTLWGSNDWEIIRQRVLMLGGMDHPHSRNSLLRIAGEHLDGLKDPKKRKKKTLKPLSVEEITPDLQFDTEDT